jgi:hypothetical protein
MKQVVNSLLENAVAGPIDTDEEVPVSKSDRNEVEIYSRLLF